MKQAHEWIQCYLLKPRIKGMSHGRRTEISQTGTLRSCLSDTSKNVEQSDYV
jgi:hypothetical protein